MYNHLEFESMEQFNRMILGCIKNRLFPRRPVTITIHSKDFGPKWKKRVAAAEKYAFAHFGNLVTFNSD